MSLSNIFSTQIPVGRIALLAWLTATFLHLEWGTEFTIRDISSVEFVVQAGYLFGYYLALMYLLRFVLLIPTAIISNLIAISIVDNDQKKAWEYNKSRHPVPDYLKMDWGKREKPDKKPWRTVDPIVVLDGNALWKRFRDRLFEIVANLGDIIAMFIAFIKYSENNVTLLAPIGIIIAFVAIVLGGFDGENKSGATNRTAE